MIPGLVPPSIGGSFQGGPSISPAKERLAQAIMGAPGEMMNSPSAMDYGPTAFDPNALKDFRLRNENNDPYAVLGNRWAPDKVDMPINSSGMLNTPNVAPPATPASLARATAGPPPQLPTTGYRPGQMPGGSVGPSPTPTSTPAASLLGAGTPSPGAPSPAMQQLQARNPLVRRHWRGIPRRMPGYGMGPQ